MNHQRNSNQKVCTDGSGGGKMMKGMVDTVPASLALTGSSPCTSSSSMTQTTTTDTTSKTTPSEKATITPLFANLPTTTVAKPATATTPLFANVPAATTTTTTPLFANLSLPAGTTVITPLFANLPSSPVTPSIKPFVSQSSSAILVGGASIAEKMRLRKEQQQLRQKQQQNLQKQKQQWSSQSMPTGLVLKEEPHHHTRTYSDFQTTPSPTTIFKQKLATIKQNNHTSRTVEFTDPSSSSTTSSSSLVKSTSNHSDGNSKHADNQAAILTTRNIRIMNQHLSSNNSSMTMEGENECDTYDMNDDYFLSSSLQQAQCVFTAHKHNEKQRQQQLMFRQMATQDRLERQQMQVVTNLHSQALSSSFYGLIKTLFFFCVMGGSLIGYVHPDYFVKLFHHWHTMYIVKQQQQQQQHLYKKHLEDPVHFRAGGMHHHHHRDHSFTSAVDKDDFNYTQNSTDYQLHHSFGGGGAAYHQDRHDDTIVEILSSHQFPMMRHMLTLYPLEAQGVKKSLPRFLWNYALATPENQKARESLRELHQRRNRLATASAAATATSHRRRRLSPQSPHFFLHVWEHSEFQQQLYGTSMDRACGPGFHVAYNDVAAAVGNMQKARKTTTTTTNANNNQQQQQQNQPLAAALELLDDLLLWCLVDSHSQDAIVKWNVNLDYQNNDLFWTDALTTPEGLVKGIAGTYWKNPNSPPQQQQQKPAAASGRVHSSLLWLPLPSSPSQYDKDPEKRQRIASRLARDTVLPWLIQFTLNLNLEHNNLFGATTSLTSYPQAFEEYLYHQIQQETTEIITTTVTETETQETQQQQQQQVQTHTPWLFLTVLCDEDDNEQTVQAAMSSAGGGNDEDQTKPHINNIQEENQPVKKVATACRNVDTLDTTTTTTSCCSFYDFRRQQQPPQRRDQQKETDDDSKDNNMGDSSQQQQHNDDDNDKSQCETQVNSALFSPS